MKTLTLGWAAINRKPQPLAARIYVWACRNADSTTAALAIVTMAACAAGVTLINMGGL